MSERLSKTLRATLGAMTLLVLVMVVQGWWRDYREASFRPAVSETTPTVSADDATDSPGPREGEGREGDAQPPAQQRQGTVRVLIDGLNFRRRPAADAKPIRGLRKGEVLTVLSERAGWYEVRSADGTKGWVSSNPNYTRLEK